MYIVQVAKKDGVKYARKYDNLPQAYTGYKYNFLKWANAKITLTNTDTNKVLLAHTNN